MTVCQITSCASRNNLRIFYKQCLTLKERGIDAVLLCNDEKADALVCGIKIFSIHKKYKNRITRFIMSGFHFYRKLKLIKADFYQIHEPELLLMGYVLSLRGEKVVWDCHEDYFYLFRHERKYIPKRFQTILGKIYELIERIIVKKFFAIITVDPAITNRYKKINANSHTVTNFPLLREDHDMVIEIKREKTISFAGMVPSGYCFDMLCQALKMINDYKLVLASTYMYKSEYERFKKEIQKYGIEEKIEFMENLTYKEVIELYKRSSLGFAVHRPINISKSKQVGSWGLLKIFEMMAAGLPMLIDKNDISRVLVEKEKCGFFVENSNSIVDVVKSIELKPEILKEKSDNCRRAYKEKYNWTSQEKTYYSIFSS